MTTSYFPPQENLLPEVNVLQYKSIELSYKKYIFKT